jgi:hypothetical protein
MPNAIYILENNQKVGPLTEGQLGEMVQSGRVRRETLCWFEGLDNWRSMGETLPHILAPVSAPAPIAVPAAATSFEVITGAVYHMPRITLSNAEVIIEAGAMHYMLGSIQMEAELPSADSSNRPLRRNAQYGPATGGRVKYFSSLHSPNAPSWNSRERNGSWTRGHSSPAIRM